MQAVYRIENPRIQNFNYVVYWSRICCDAVKEIDVTLSQLQETTNTLDFSTTLHLPTPV